MSAIGLLGRKKGSLCIWMGLCVVSLCVISVSESRTGKSGEEAYAVSIRHYGVNAREMERCVAIPLEDALYSIPGAQSIQSFSENGLARVYVRFRNSRKGQYEAVRDAAQKIYEGLPSSAQRPEIQSSDNSRIPVWSAAVYSSGGDIAETAALLERVLKPRLEGLEGAGEVFISGSGLQEIIVALDQEKAAALGITSRDIARTLGMNDALFPGGVLTHEGQEITVTVDTRLGSVESWESIDCRDLESALIWLEKGGAVRLSEIAEVYGQERMPDTLSRLNGKKAAVVSVMANAGADLRKLSRDIKRELETLKLPLEFTFLSDRGAEEAAAFRSVFLAAVQGACVVALISFLLGRGGANSQLSTWYSGFFSALFVPCVCLVSAALLPLFGFSLDSFVLGGIAAGIGAAVDPVILLGERLGRCGNFRQARAVIGEISGPVIAGAATTTAALIPLAGAETGAAPIVWAIGTVTLAALVLSLTLMPPLLLWDTGKPGRVSRGKYGLPGRRFARRVSRKICRFLVTDAHLCVRYPHWICAAALILTAAGITAFVIRGTDTAARGSEDSVYGHIEFEGGFLAGEVDRLLATYSETLAEKKGIKNVQTGARTGTGSVLISFDSKLIDSGGVRQIARSISIPGGFLFFPETSTKERYWEITISGDDDRRLRELAAELARLCGTVPMIRECVLNFKEGGKNITLTPKRDIFSKSGLTFYQAADTLRRAIHGPVAYKKMTSSGEVDVRVRTRDSFISPNNDGRDMLRKNDIPEMIFTSPNSDLLPLRADIVMDFQEGQELSSIRREDRRRTASITVSTRPVDPRRVKAELEKIFMKLELPAGYSIEFDTEAIRKSQELTETFFYFLLVLIFCYMIIASVNESFSLPLAVLAAIPPSLAFPAIFLVVSGGSFNSAAACAFVAVSGMAVNAAVLCASGLEHFLKAENGEKVLSLYRALRNRLPALCATTATSVAGSLPFLLLRENSNILVRTLSLVAALGVGASAFCSITVVPALALIINRLRRQFFLWKGISACAESDA